MIIKKDSATINESIGVSEERAKEIGDILKNIFEASTKEGMFDGVKCIKQIEQSGQIKLAEEWYLVFFRIGIYLGGMFEREAAQKRAIAAMRQISEVAQADLIRKPKKTIIN